MKTLENLIKDLNETVKDANKNVDELPYNTRSGWAVRIQDARRHLQEVQGEYKQALLQNGVAIIARGDQTRAKALGALVEAEGEGFCVDASLLYERLADMIEPSLSDLRVWGTTQNYGLIAGLESILKETGVSEMTPFKLVGDVVLKDHQALVQHIRGLIRDAVGDTLNRSSVVHNLVQKALDVRFVGKMVPVMIVNAQEDELLGLTAPFAKGSAKVNISNEEDINQEYMIKVFKEAQRQIRKK